MLNIKEFEEISYGSGVNGSGIVTLAAEVSPVAWVLSLAQEVQHAMHAAKKKKKFIFPWFNSQNIYGGLRPQALHCVYSGGRAPRGELSVVQSYSW